MFIIDDLLSASVRGVISIVSKLFTVRHGARVRKPRWKKRFLSPSADGEHRNDPHR